MLFLIGIAKSAVFTNVFAALDEKPATVEGADKLTRSGLNGHVDS